MRRSLGIAERIGETSIMSGSVGNLGIISARFGDLLEAESMFQRGISLAEQINDPVYISFWYGYLSPVLQHLGKLNEASFSLGKALKTSRAIHFAPCTGIALLALGKIRIIKALIVQRNNTRLVQAEKQLSPIQWLYKARNSLRHVLVLDGLELETRIECLQAQAQIAFLLGEIASAHQQTLQIIEEVRNREQSWLLACALRLLGCILATELRYEEASANFEQSLTLLQVCGMRLEWALTQCAYAESILLHYHQDDNYERAIARLQEARKVFEECGATLDIELVDRVLAEYNTPVEMATHKRDR